MKYIMNRAEVLKLLAELGAVIRSNDSRQTPIVEPRKKDIKNVGSSSASQPFGKGKTRKTVDNDEPVLALKIKEIDRDLFHREGSNDRKERLRLLRREKTLACLASPNELRDIVLHTRPVIELAGIRVRFHFA